MPAAYEMPPSRKHVIDLTLFGPLVGPIRIAGPSISAPRAGSKVDVDHRKLKSRK
ncbi:hypothetical protein X770_31725 [Mesorhizobium sp. LSJC269B00]|nr:hypothetical protein X770_31725 [Mesorhizobium sp. LSJC269B00]